MSNYNTVTIFARICMLLTRNRMRFTSILKPERIRTRMETQPLSAEEKETLSEEDILEKNRKKVISELTELFAKSDAITNESQLYTDLLQREKRASTALGNEVALPHVRTMQATDLVMVVARSDKGFEFDAPDDKPVRLFIGIVSPPYDDSTYLKIYKRLGEILQDEDLLERLLSNDKPGEILRDLNRYQ